MHVLARDAAAAGEREGIRADDTRAVHPGNLLSIDPVPVAVLNVPRPVKKYPISQQPHRLMWRAGGIYIYIHRVAAAMFDI